MNGERYCPGGPAVETEWGEHIARCRCGLWFTTLMDEPVFRPHTIHADGTATWSPLSDELRRMRDDERY